MRKLVFLVLIVALAANVSYAQDAKKTLKSATKALAAYNLDKTANAAKLGEAVEAIDKATAMGGESGDSFDAWLAAGDIYGKVIEQIGVSRQLNLGTENIPMVDAPAVKAANGYTKALAKAEKKWQTKKALAGLERTQQDLYNAGIFAYEDKKYGEAYTNFAEVKNVHKVLKDNGRKSTLDDAATASDLAYVTGLSAMNADMKDAAKAAFMPLYEAGTDKAVVYESLYKIEAGDKSEAELTAAYPYLEKGRAQFPDDEGLLYTEINHFLQMNKLDDLIGKLEMAIQKDPDNISLYTTLGNVYDNLYQRESGEGNMDKANEYFDKAMTQYKNALDKDANDSFAVYSLGALYFNRAAGYTTKMSQLSTSRDDQKKYDEYKAKSQEDFTAAFPHFKKAESLNPNDLNTLIALKEILVRLGDYETSNEFKNRLKVVQDGGKNEASYYK